ncbi:MbcA/ParS/Xre antitoxin family protein [Marinomonas lutimaris]|uniref:MbcA/ParS/Xre antitoxin family protein n=1 Tax=Marinomonas lutimaris TaxID=2846746 RepID=UPI001C672F00|nr:MbcA/ParS/Xre antitoxin family protein [Marinomonas lutimaris]
MSTKRKNYSEKCIDIHDIENSLDLVMNESKGSPVAVMKDGNPVFYCVPADTYAAILELVDASEMRKLNESVHQLGLELFGDEDKWKSWIKTPVQALGGKLPESMMVTKEGINRVRDLLGQISHGVVV